jgi:hypothetical protein
MTNASDTRNSGPGRRNVLVLSTVEELGSSLQAHLQDDDVVKVVVPVVGQGVLDWLANDERAFSHAVEVADRLAEELPGETVDAGAGESDVALAIRDALATFPADEILIAVSRDDEDVRDAVTAASGAPAGSRYLDGIPLRFVSVI